MAKISVKQVAIFSILTFVLALPLIAQADGELSWRGAISSRPAGVAGTWEIGGIAFEATAATQLNEEHGALNTGDCAEVKYYVSGGSNIATEIERKSTYMCNTGGGGDDGEHAQVYAVVDSLPAGFPADMTGDWVAGGVTYTADAGTRFEQEHGPFAVGVCIEVEYDNSTGVNVMLAAKTENGYKCGSGGGGGEGPHSQLNGILDSFPAGLIGDWVVAGVTYTADANTRFEQEHGPFFAGACVDVKFETGTTNLIEVSTSNATMCNTVPGTGGGDDEHPEEKFYGLISDVPADPQNGLWLIGGGAFSSTLGTELKEEHGAFAQADANPNTVCAEVEYYQNPAGGQYIATKIGTEELYKCTTSSFTNEVYGTVLSFPPDLYGSWVIAGGVMSDTYNTSVTTNFEQDDGRTFAVGACVKVKYTVQNGVNHVRKIETTSPEHCGGGSEPPSYPGEGKMYATIDSMPPIGSMSLRLGTWVIGGQEYQATDATRFEDEHNQFAPGACVKAKYVVQGGVKYLTKLEAEEAYKCRQTGGAEDEFKAYGYVEAFPGSGTLGSLVGPWQISGVTYQTDANTAFEQEHGFFALGAFVEVEYTTSGAVNTATKIETHVAPHAGTGTFMGTVTGQNDDNGDGWPDWELDGTDIYLTDRVIEFGGGGQPAIGDRVLLNTYRGLDGRLYVTSAGVVQHVFLPLILR